MGKVIPWAKVKKDYLEGITTKDLAEKYKVKAKTIQDKAGHEKWTAEKSTIYKNIHENVKEKITSLTNKALATLESIIEDDLAKDCDRVSAARAVLDISGLKSSKQEITGADGSPLVQKVFITPDEVKETDKHIDEVISES